MNDSGVDMNLYSDIHKTIRATLEEKYITDYRIVKNVFCMSTAQLTLNRDMYIPALNNKK